MGTRARPASDRAHAERPTPGLRGLAFQVLLVGLFALTYFGIRGITRGSDVTALAHAARLADLESWLGVAWEPRIQDAIVGNADLVALANWVYIYGHWPVIVSTLVVLYLRCPPRYYLLRNAIFISGMIGMVFFVLLPMAPPRFGTIDVVDTVSERSQGYRALQPPSLTNPYAAMPSLHFGWNMLVGIVLWKTSRRAAVRVFAVVMPVAMAWAVVATGNHYVLDVVVGGAVALVGLVLALNLPRVIRTPDWAREGP